jgi:hypothetical protein
MVQCTIFIFLMVQREFLLSPLLISTMCSLRATRCYEYIGNIRTAETSTDSYSKFGHRLRAARVPCHSRHVYWLREDMSTDSQQTRVPTHSIGVYRLTADSSTYVNSQKRRLLWDTYYRHIYWLTTEESANSQQMHLLTQSKDIECNKNRSRGGSHQW